MRLRLTTLMLVVATTLAALIAAPAGTRTIHSGRGVQAPTARARASAVKLTRFSLAHGCYRVRIAGGRELGTYRMQPAALGDYVLYDQHGRFLGPALTDIDAASNATVWRVERHFTLTNRKTSRTVPVSFRAATGCAVYPEAQVGAAGRSFHGANPAAGVLGTAEGHAHVTGYELFGGDWHCGRPWSPFGAPYALPASCASKQQGTNGAVEAFLDYGSPTRPAGMHGWPTFVDWPAPTTLAEEGDYWTAIERAWKAGLRLMVTNLVDNEPLCRVMTTRQHACNDMVSVRIQSRDLYEIENYIDAQAGGPGKGFFRIVTDPFQARKVINQGKLAVIEGIEVSRLFGCGEVNNVPQCGRAQVDAGLREVHRLGVRTFFPVHEFNNAFGGSKMIGGETGAIINAGNREETGSFFTLKPCPARDQDAEQLTFPATGALADLLNGPLASLLAGNPLPIYNSGPQCNTRGLTSLGAYLIRKMAAQHQVIQLDHMDSKTATAALAIAEHLHYAGVVSAHCCSSAQLFHRVYSAGGFITEPQSTPGSFVTTMRSDRSQRSPRYLFGFGYGSDMNGLSGQAGPTPANPVHYPFHSLVGHVTFGPEVWGRRSFNFNRVGLANYGLYADWLQAVAQAGGPSTVHDMFHGAEGYLQMWERAYGVRSQHCLSSREAGRIRHGENFRGVLYGAGQPASRSSSWSYCVARGPFRRLVIRFDRRGRVTSVIRSR